MNVYRFIGVEDRREVKARDEASARHLAMFQKWGPRPTSWGKGGIYLGLGLILEECIDEIDLIQIVEPS